MGKQPGDPPKIHMNSVLAVLRLFDGSALLYIRGNALVRSPLKVEEVVDLFMADEGPVLHDLSEDAGFPVWVRGRAVTAIPEDKEILLVDGRRISHRDADPGAA